MKILPADMADAAEGELLANIISRIIVFPLLCSGAGYCGGCAVKVVREEISKPRKEELTRVLSKRPRYRAEPEFLEILNRSA